MELILDFLLLSNNSDLKKNIKLYIYHKFMAELQNVPNENKNAKVYV